MNRVRRELYESAIKSFGVPPPLIHIVRHRQINSFQVIIDHGPGLWPEETGLPAVEHHHGS